MAERPPTSFRLTKECRELIRTLAGRLGIRDAAVVEIAVRRMAEQELGPAETAGAKQRTRSARKGK